MLKIKLIAGLMMAICMLLTSAFADIRADTSNIMKPPVNEAKIIAPTTKFGNMTRAQIIRALRAANAVAAQMKKFGHHPFGAVLVAPDNETILMSQGNLSAVRHAETELARRAAETYPAEYLSKCTLVTTMEPCAMCAGTIYFANIGRVVYGVTESTLGKLTGSSQVTPTMHMPCRQVFAAGQKLIQVIGPVPEMNDEVVKVHKGFWGR